MAKATSSNVKPKVWDSGQKEARGRRHLREDEARRLIEAAGRRGRYPARDKLLVRLTYRLGLRAAEAVGLRWTAIDLDGGTITVKRAKGGATFTHPIERDDKAALRKLYAAATGPWVFKTERGGPLSVDALQYIVREAGKRADLGDAVNPHALRHGAGYSLINQGADLRFVQDYLGHQSITSTSRYTALSPARMSAFRVR
jgi:type 1 fimbriae regulatory protein FimB